VVKIDQDLEAGGDHLVRLSALDIGHESDAARVMLVAGVIKSLRWRKTRQIILSTGIAPAARATGVPKSRLYARGERLSIPRVPAGFNSW
jgi:hypothetical protein